MQKYQGDALRRRLRMSIAIAGPTLVCFLSSGSAGAMDRAVYTTFDPAGSVNTYATCMSDNGIIAGNYYDSKNVSHGFVRAADGTITSFDPKGSIDTTVGYVRCVNTNGWVAGSFEDASQVWHGYLRSPHGKITVFDPKGSTATYASGINSGRTIVGYYNDDKGRSLAYFRTADGTITSFHRGSYSWSSEASAINRKGEIVGWITKVFMWGNSITKGFARSPGGKYRMLEGAVPTDINDGGFVTGVVPCSYPLLCSSSFVWAPDGKVTEFSPHHANLSAGNCINQDEHVAGSYEGRVGGRGYIRLANGTIHTFSFPGSSETSAIGCDAKGNVAGYYFDNTNVSHGFIRSSGE